MHNLLVAKVELTIIIKCIETLHGSNIFITGQDSESLVKCLRKIKPDKLVYNQTMFEECKLMGVDPRYNHYKTVFEFVFTVFSFQAMEANF